MPSRPRSNSCLETSNGNALCAPNSTDSHDSIPEESHKFAIHPKCNLSTFSFVLIFQVLLTNIYFVIRFHWLDRILI